MPWAQPGRPGWCWGLSPSFPFRDSCHCAVSEHKEWLELGVLRTSLIEQNVSSVSAEHESHLAAVQELPGTSECSLCQVRNGVADGVRSGSDVPTSGLRGGGQQRFGCQRWCLAFLQPCWACTVRALLQGWAAGAPGLSWIAAQCFSSPAAWKAIQVF